MRTPSNERLSAEIGGGPRARNHAAAAERTAAPGRERRCALTGQCAPADTMVRLVLSSEGQVHGDIRAKAPGRGAWIAATRAQLRKAIDNGALRAALARAFKRAAIEVPADLDARIEDALRQALLDRLGLEHRCGHLALGSERIAKLARQGAVHLLLHASDAAEDGVSSLDQALRVGQRLSSAVDGGRSSGAGAGGIVLPLDRAALSVALGRNNVVHCALTDSAAAQRVRAQLERYERFVAGGQGDWHDHGSRCERQELNV